MIALAKTDFALADAGAAWLIRQRQAHGAWGATQSTVLALQALAATGASEMSSVAAKLFVNGKELPGAFEVSDRAQSVDVSPHLRAGANEIVIESASKLNAQIAGRTYLPWTSDDVIRGVEGIDLKVTYDKTEVKVGETLRCTVSVKADAVFTMAEVAIPPSFTVDSAALDALVEKRIVDKVAQNGRALIFYLPGKAAIFSYELRPRYPATVSVPRSIAYEYYTPDRRAISPPQELTVR